MRDENDIGNGPWFERSNTSAAQSLEPLCRKRGPCDRFRHRRNRHEKCRQYDGSPRNRLRANRFDQNNKYPL